MMLTIASLLALQTAPLVIEVLGVPPPPALAAADIIAAGRATFTARCQMCHGLDGNADTPVGRALKPPPQRFTDPLWQGRVTDGEIKKAILEGGAAVKRSPAMPAFKDLTPATSLRGRGNGRPKRSYFGRFAPYFERRCLRFFTPCVSSTPRRM